MEIILPAIIIGIIALYALFKTLANCVDSAYDEWIRNSEY